LRRPKPPIKGGSAPEEEEDIRRRSTGFTSDIASLKRCKLKSKTINEPAPEA